MVVARGIFSVTHVNLVVRTLLGLLTGHIPFTLLSDNAIDETFLRLEVIAHDFRFVRRFAILEDRRSGCHPCRILHTAGKYRTAIHIHGNDGRSQLDILVIDLSVSIQVGKSSTGKHDGVTRLVYHRGIQRVFFLCRITPHRIQCKRIYQ